MSEESRPAALTRRIDALEHQIQQRRHASVRHLAAIAARIESVATSPVILLVAAGSGYLIGRLQVFRSAPTEVRPERGGIRSAASAVQSAWQTGIYWFAMLLPVYRWVQQAAAVDARESSGSPVAESPRPS